MPLRYLFMMKMKPIKIDDYVTKEACKRETIKALRQAIKELRKNINYSSKEIKKIKRSLKKLERKWFYG